MASSRVLVSAMTHEVRNLCGAVAVVHENLARSRKLRGDQDFEALGTLVAALTQIASVQLRQSSRQSRVEELDLREVLDDLRVVLDPLLRRCRHPGGVERRRSCRPDRVDQSASPASGAAEPHEEQPPRAAGSGRQAHHDRGERATRCRLDPRRRLRARTRRGRSSVSTVSERRSLHGLWVCMCRAPSSDRFAAIFATTRIPAARS